MQIRLNNDMAKAILSLALSANMSGATVDADGTGACGIWGDTEDMNVLFILPPDYR